MKIKSKAEYERLLRKFNKVIEDDLDGKKKHLED